MKILQIATQVPVPATDGGKLSIYGITKSLYERGHNIDFVCYLKNDSYDQSFKLLSKVCTPFILKVQTDNSLSGALFNLFSNIPYNASKYYKKELTKFLEKYFLDNNPDIIQIDHLFLGWAVKIIRKFTRAPVVLRSQNLEMNIMKRYYENKKNFLIKYYAKLQYKKFLEYEPLVCSNFDLCIMISNIDKKELLKFNPKVNVVSIPAGVDNTLLEIPKKEVIPYSLVHIGHTDWYPNYDALNWFINEVFHDLVREIPAMQLFIYGGGNTYKFPIPLSLKKNIRVIGFVENPWKELQDKALAVVPLRIGSGIRLKILELLSTGTNVITTSIGKEGIDVEHGKELLIADSKEEIFQKILEFFQGKYDVVKLRENGKKLIAENYTWSGIAAKFEKVYDELIENEP